MHFNRTVIRLSSRVRASSGSASRSVAVSSLTVNAHKRLQYAFPARQFSSVPLGSDGLIRAYNSPTGLPIEHLLTGEALTSAKQECLPYYSYPLTPRQLCDLEMILNGAFTPLSGFMTEKEYNSVVETMRLPNGILFPMPITLDISEKHLKAIENHPYSKHITLRDVEGNGIAILDIVDIYKPDKRKEAQLVFKGDPEHPAIDYLMSTSGTYYIGGRLRGLQLPIHYDHHDLRKTPLQTRLSLPRTPSTTTPTNNHRSIVAFQTRNPLHRAHYELTRNAQRSLANPLTQEEGFLLLHPVVGMTKPGDIDAQTRIKCYRSLMNRYPVNTAMLSIIPLAMRMGGPREAIWHALIRQNYGASHFIIGRDHAGPGSNSHGIDFYSAYEARDTALSYQKELDIQLLPYEQMVYVENDKKYYPIDNIPKGAKTFNLSGTEVRRRLMNGTEIPEWFSFPEVVSILRQRHPPKTQQGYCLFFTGLSGSGKSSVAMALRERLLSIDDRKICLLDGDEVRSMISSELTFSQEHRNLNIRRIGWIASQIVMCGGCVIACPIAPYTSSRQEARKMVLANGGGFIEIYMDANVDVCSARDRKGLYAKARMGLLKGMTGIDDPYEAPQKPELTVHSTTSIEQAVDQIVTFLRQNGYLKGAAAPQDATKG